MNLQLPFMQVSESAKVYAESLKAPVGLWVFLWV